MRINALDLNQLDHRIPLVPQYAELLGIKDLELYLPCPPNNFGTIKTNHLVQAFKNLPLFVTGLNLCTTEGLHNKTAGELAAIFSAIPHTVSQLALHYDNLHKRHGDDLATAVKSLSVSTLKLSNNHTHKNAEKLIKTLKALPECVTSLELTSFELNTYTLEELVDIIKAIPTTVRSLNFSDNDLGLVNGDHFITLCKTIPKTITSLNLSENHLGEFDIETLTSAFSALPALTSLQFGNNELHRMSAEDLATLCQLIPRSVTHLDLTNNALSTHQLSTLQTAFANLPELDSLNLSNFLDLAKPQKTQLPDFLPDIAVPTLDISFNWLNQISWGILLEGLNPKVRTLTLGINIVNMNLFWLQEFKKIPPTLTSLDIIYDFYGKHLSMTELLTLIDYLPNTLGSVYLSNNHALPERSPEDLAKLRQALANKSFFLVENGTDLSSATVEALEEVITLPPLQDIILSYLANEDEHVSLLRKPIPPCIRPPADPIQASLLLQFITHPATKIISSLLLIAGLIGLILVAFSVAGLELAVASVSSIVIGGGLLVAGFFADRKTEQDGDMTQESPALTA